MLPEDEETGSATWGTIGGELSNQTDLKVMLDSKADKSKIPTVNNTTITFTQGNAVKGSITLNQANDQTISLDAGGGGGGGGGGDDIYCKYGLITDDPPGLHLMTINNGQTYIDYSQIDGITNYSSKPSKIVGYFEIVEADSQDYEIVVGTTGYDNNNNNVSFVWKGNAGSNGAIKVPFIMTYNPMSSSNYIQVNGGWSTIFMYITAIYNGGNMKGSFQ